MFAKENGPTPVKIVGSGVSGSLFSSSLSISLHTLIQTCQLIWCLDFAFSSLRHRLSPQNHIFMWNLYETFKFSSISNLIWTQVFLPSSGSTDCLSLFSGSGDAGAGERPSCKGIGRLIGYDYNQSCKHVLFDILKRRNLQIEPLLATSANPNTWRILTFHMFWCFCSKSLRRESTHQFQPSASM